MTVHGIKNCDTVKKACKWLEAQNIAYHFHDFKKEGLEEKELKAWVNEVGYETLLNTRGTTWRKLPEAQKQPMDEARAIPLMLDNLSLIKRPVVKKDSQVFVGFSVEKYEAIWKKS